MAAMNRRAPLSPDEAHALNASAFAADEFEPFVGRIVDSGTLQQVIREGLVEAGPSCRPAVGMIGYRLTAKGWVQFNRQAHSQMSGRTAVQNR